MNPVRLRLAGQIILGAVAAVLILAGVFKLMDMGAEDMIEGLKKASLLQHKTTISITAIVCGALLFVPYTRWFGVLMSTAYWGGAIVAHMTYNDSIVMPAVFLGVMWAGAAILWKSEKV